MVAAPAARRRPMTSYRPPCGAPAMDRWAGSWVEQAGGGWRLQGLSSVRWWSGEHTVGGARSIDVVATAAVPVDEFSATVLEARPDVGARRRPSSLADLPVAVEDREVSQS
jgi:hypothetical protein